MTKKAEIDSLHTYTESLPRDSYLRPWLEDVLPQVQADIRNDFPVAPSLTITRHECRKLEEATAISTGAIIAKATSEAEEIKRLARAEAERIMNSVRSRLREVERLINT
jgi:hypothetical protein